MQNRINTRVFHTLGTTGVILLLVLSLAVGATYCRYSTLIQGQMALKAGLSPQPTLYSLDGENWTELGNQMQLGFSTNTTFMGTRSFLFCYATEKAGGYADFDYYKVTQ